MVNISIFLGPWFDNYRPFKKMLNCNNSLRKKKVLTWLNSHTNGTMVLNSDITYAYVAKHRNNCEIMWTTHRK